MTRPAKRALLAGVVPRRLSQRIWRAASLGLAVASCLVATGCGGGTGAVLSSGGDDRSGLVAVQQLEEALGGEPEDAGLLGSAAAAFMDGCLAEQGFSNGPEYSNGSSGSEEDYEKMREAELDYWWGVSLPEYARKYGYHEPPVEDFLEVWSASETPSSEMMEAQVGAAFMAGETDQPGGCVGRWDEEAYAGVSMTSTEMQDAVSQLRTQFSEESRRRDAAVTAVAKWSTCMADEGYSYAEPHDALSQFTSTVGNPDGRDGIAWNTTAPTQEEIRIAVADAQCKAETSFWDLIAVAEDEAAQTVLDSQRPLIEELQRENDRLAENAARILASRPPA